MDEEIDIDLADYEITPAGFQAVLLGMATVIAELAQDQERCVQIVQNNPDELRKLAEATQRLQTVYLEIPAGQV